MEHGDQVMCILGKITAWSHPGFAEGQGLEVESQERGGLGMTYGEASPCVIFLILWHETESFSVSLEIYLG